MLVLASMFVLIVGYLAIFERYDSMKLRTYKNLGRVDKCGEWVFGMAAGVINSKKWGT